MNTQLLDEFQYRGQSIEVLGTPDKPLFIAREICDALNISNHRDALTRLDEDEKGVGISDTPGGKQEILLINEPGLYNLVLRSTKPEAKAFKRWVTHEVLPAIRKKGRYQAATHQALPGEEPAAERIIRLQQKIITLQERLLEATPPEKRQKEYRPPADLSTKKEVYRLRTAEDMSWAEISEAVGYSRSSCRNYYLEMKAGMEEEL